MPSHPPAFSSAGSMALSLSDIARGALVGRGLDLRVGPDWGVSSQAGKGAKEGSCWKKGSAKATKNWCFLVQMFVAAVEIAQHPRAPFSCHTIRISVKLGKLFPTVESKALRRAACL